MIHEKYFVLLVTLLSFSQLLSSEALAKDDAGKLYYKAIKHYEAKRWAKAKPIFQKALQLLRQRKTKSAKAKHYLILGRCDILFLLSQIERELKQGNEACLRLASIQDNLKSVPKGWQNWKVNPLLKERMAKAKKQLGLCKAEQPTTLALSGLPKGAIIEQLVVGAGGKKVWKRAKVPLKTLEESVTFRIRADGYKTRTMTVRVKQWKKNNAKVALAPKPRKRVVIRRPPPRKIKPPPKKGIPVWVWVVGGAVIAGAAVTVGILATQDDRATFEVDFNK